MFKQLSLFAVFLSCIIFTVESSFAANSASLALQYKCYFNNGEAVSHYMRGTINLVACEIEGEKKFVISCGQEEWSLMQSVAAGNLYGYFLVKNNGRDRRYTIQVASLSFNWINAAGQQTLWVSSQEVEVPSAHTFFVGSYRGPEELSLYCNFSFDRWPL